jgi:hypothetical protein
MGERLLVGQLEGDMVEAAVGAAADRRSGELGKAEGEVLVGARPVDEPAVTVAVGRIAEDDATERPRSIVRRVLANAWPVAEAAAAATLKLDRRRRHHQSGDEHGHGPDARHLVSLRRAAGTRVVRPTKIVVKTQGLHPGCGYSSDLSDGTASWKGTRINS